MKFLNNLIEDFNKNILFENLSDEPPKKISRIIATLAEKDDFLFTFYSEHVLWKEKPGYGTCGVRPYGDGHHIIFIYDPEYFLNASTHYIYYLLGHEIYHILRDHAEREAEHQLRSGKNKLNHHIMNIVMDAFIDADLKSEGALGGHLMEPDDPGYAFRGGGGNWGDLEEWVNDSISKIPDPNNPGKNYANPGLRYNGPKMAEPCYDWIIKTFKDHGVDLEEETQEHPSPTKPKKNYPKPGMIIRGPDGSYGQIISVDDSSKKVTEIMPLTKEEAYEMVRNQRG